MDMSEPATLAIFRGPGRWCPAGRGHAYQPVLPADRLFCRCRVRTNPSGKTMAYGLDYGCCRHAGIALFHVA